MKFVLFTILLVTFIVCVCSSSLYDELEALHFVNEGRVNSNDRFQWVHQSVMYTEPENVTKADYAWGSVGSFKYLYQITEESAESCTISEIIDDIDFPGNDMGAFIGTIEDCKKSCCDTLDCVGFIHTDIAPSPFSECQQGKPCCYLKNDMSISKPYSSLKAYKMDISKRPIVPPPLGMRSSIPLGGIATGNIELRADGTFHEWTIVNQSPAGSAKYSYFEDTVFAIKTESAESAESALIRTHPPYNLPGVPSLVYSGTYPVSRLSIPQDNNIFQTENTIYAFPHFVANNLNASLAPAINFVLNTKNIKNYPVKTSFLFTMSINMEENQHRISKSVLKIDNTTTSVDCKNLCIKEEECSSWTWKNRVCSLNTDIPYNEFEEGSFSGIRGSWSVSPDGNTILLSRVGSSSASGQLALSLGNSQDQKTLKISLYIFFLCYTSSSLTNSYSSIVGIIVEVTVQPSERLSLPIIMTWFFPHHNYKTELLDNFYTHLWSSATDVYHYVNKDIASLVHNIMKYQESLMTSSIPNWLKDTLVNSVSHMRYAMYFADGRWRQWEAPDCVNIDSIHNDYERHMPYMLYFPETEKMKLYTWATFQMENGMFREELAQGYYSDTPELDSAIEFEGRRMSDCSSMFAMALVEHYKWNKDRQVVTDLYNNAKRGIQWHLDVSKTYGLPEKLCNTYDIMGPEGYALFGYNGVAHIMGLQAMRELAIIMNDQEWIKKMNIELDRARNAFIKYHWNGEYFKSYSDGTPAEHIVGSKEPLMSDTFYPAVLSYIFGLDDLIDKELLKSHLIQEYKHNQSPFGLIIMTGRTAPGLKNNDNHIWMMAPNDWAALGLYYNPYNTTNVDEYLDVSKRALENVRERLHDLWNTHGVYYNFDGDLAGQPSITAHYGYHMTSWYLPFTLSGQRADLSKGELTFDPKIQGDYIYPVLLPNFDAQLIHKENHYSLRVIRGSITVNTLKVKDLMYPTAVTLEEGKTYDF
ncbi:hypothetical protein WA158_004915 [Blastocystis sp. Blastoise]